MLIKNKQYIYYRTRITSITSNDDNLYFIVNESLGQSVSYTIECMLSKYSLTYTDKN